MENLFFTKNKNEVFHGYVSLPKGTQDNPFKIDEVVGLGDNLYYILLFFGGVI